MCGYCVLCAHYCHCILAARAATAMLLLLSFSPGPAPLEERAWFVTRRRLCACWLQCWLQQCRGCYLHSTHLRYAAPPGKMYVCVCVWGGGVTIGGNEWSWAFSAVASAPLVWQHACPVQWCSECLGPAILQWCSECLGPAILQWCSQCLGPAILQCARLCGGRSR